MTVHAQWKVLMHSVGLIAFASVIAFTSFLIAKTQTPKFDETVSIAHGRFILAVSAPIQYVLFKLQTNIVSSVVADIAATESFAMQCVITDQLLDGFVMVGPAVIGSLPSNCLATQTSCKRLSLSAVGVLQDDGTTMCMWTDHQHLTTGPIETVVIHPIRQVLRLIRTVFVTISPAPNIPTQITALIDTGYNITSVLTADNAVATLSVCIGYIGAVMFNKTEIRVGHINMMDNHNITAVASDESLFCATEATNCGNPVEMRFSFVSLDSTHTLLRIQHTAAAFVLPINGLAVGQATIIAINNKQVNIVATTSLTIANVSDNITTLLIRHSLLLRHSLITRTGWVYAFPCSIGQLAVPSKLDFNQTVPWKLQYVLAAQTSNLQAAFSIPFSALSWIATIGFVNGTMRRAHLLPGELTAVPADIKEIKIRSVDQSLTTPITWCLTNEPLVHIEFLPHNDTVVCEQTAVRNVTIQTPFALLRTRNVLGATSPFFWSDNAVTYGNLDATPIVVVNVSLFVAAGGVFTKNRTETAEYWSTFYPPSDSLCVVQQSFPPEIPHIAAIPRWFTHNYYSDSAATACDPILGMITCNVVYCYFYDKNLIVYNGMRIEPSYLNFFYPGLPVVCSITTSS